MAGRSACHPPETHELRRRPPEAIPNYPRPHHGIAGQDKDKAALTQRIASASPLRNVDTNRMSPAQNRPLPSATASVTSRASTLLASPLDDIPERIWPRVLRPANTPETTTPELSIDEITSTRLSLDDQAFLTSIPGESDRKKAHSRRVLMKTTFGYVWGENSGRFKKITKRLRNIPNGLFTRKDRRSREVSTPTTIHAFPTSESAVPQLELTTELCVPTMRKLPDGENSADSKPALLMDYECKPKDSDSCQEEMTKISSLIRKDLYEARNRDRILPFPRSGISDPLPRHFLGVPTFNNISPSLVAQPAHNAEDRLLHGPRSLRATSRQGTGRASSVTSIGEMRAHAFGSRRTRRPSLSGFSFNHNSALSISRTSHSTRRPATHSGPASSFSATRLPQKTRLFRDGLKAGSESLCRIPDPQKRPSTSSTARPVSNETALGTRLENHSNTSTVCVPAERVEAGFGNLPDCNKIPIHVPRRVEQEGLSRHPEDEEDSAENNEWLCRHPSMTVATSPVSETSFGSLSMRGHWSIRSFLERQATEQEQALTVELHSTVGSRTKALYASLFQGGR